MCCSSHLLTDSISLIFLEWLPRLSFFYFYLIRTHVEESFTSVSYKFVDGQLMVRVSEVLGNITIACFIYLSRVTNLQLISCAYSSQQAFISWHCQADYLTQTAELASTIFAYVLFFVTKVCHEIAVDQKCIEQSLRRIVNRIIRGRIFSDP